MEQIERITLLEQRLNRALAAVRQLETALDAFEAAREDVKALEGYYGGEEWKQDYHDDEAGRLPSDLPRGVLSEDAVWNLLADCRELNIKMLEVVASSL